MSDKFSLPAFFNFEYYKSRYDEQMRIGNPDLAKIWEKFYFDNALSFAFCEVFEANRSSVDGSKQAMVLAEARKKELEKLYKAT